MENPGKTSQSLVNLPFVIERAGFLVKEVLAVLKIHDGIFAIAVDRVVIPGRKKHTDITRVAEHLAGDGSNLQIADDGVQVIRGEYEGCEEKGRQQQESFRAHLYRRFTNFRSGGLWFQSADTCSNVRRMVRLFPGASGARVRSVESG